MLEISKKFFSHLNDSNIRYCHWKSNINLDRSLDGKTDLDILVDPDYKEEFYEALKKFDFKQIVSPPEKQFPGLEDWLGFDSETGNLIHLHVHYRLLLGQRYIKNHHFPIEEFILNNCIEKDNVLIPRPEIELFLLVIRAHMKVDLLSLFKHCIKDLMRHRYTAFPAAIEEEFSELINTSNLDKLNDYLQLSELPVASSKFLKFLNRFQAGKLKSIDIIVLQQYLFRRLKKFRRETGLSVYLNYAFSVVKQSPCVHSLVKPAKKTRPGRGSVIALVGADGSGKSSLTQALQKWLSWKVETPLYYYGIPKTGFLKFLSFVIRGFKKLRLNSVAAYVECFMWFFVARHRFSVSLNSQLDANSGKIVITDRFPMKDFFAMDEPMDGPRIRKCINSDNQPFLQREESYYGHIQSPDKIFLLKVDLEELRRRKSDLELSVHKIKAEAVNSVVENGLVRVIDANKGYDQVELELKKMIWDIL